MYKILQGKESLVTISAICAFQIIEMKKKSEEFIVICTTKDEKAKKDNCIFLVK